MKFELIWFDEPNRPLKALIPEQFTVKAQKDLIPWWLFKMVASMEAAVFNCQCDQMQNCEGDCETIYSQWPLRRLCAFVYPLLSVDSLPSDASWQKTMSMWLTSKIFCWKVGSYPGTIFAFLRVVFLASVGASRNWHVRTKAYLNIGKPDEGRLQHYSNAA